MFERLAGKLLNHFLAKYFVQNQEIEQRKSTQLKVWSGYISLENLEFRQDVVNELLQNSGVEMVSGSIASLEITIPWGKLGAPAKDDDAAVVVVVLDGVHLLLRTNYEYNDEALRQNAIASRRTALADSESYGRKETPSRSKLIQKRITEGILKDLMEKLHFHIRDLHVRLEDVLSDPANPYACGMTLESLHVQAEDEHYMEEEDGSDVIRKEGQLNHFAIYWTAIDFDQGLPVEMSVLHAKDLSTIMLAKALNKCIARRGSALASPSRAGATDYAPKHTYLLRPVDATSHAALSTKPANLKERPSFVCSIAVDDLSIHIRDFQSAGMLALASSLKEHTFIKQYRPYRPSVSPQENPRAWWRYAAQVVRMELRESRMRWSWSRFHQRYEMRRRYCHLYERQCRYPSTSTASSPRNASSGALQSLSIRPAQEAVDQERQTPDPHLGAPDEGAGPTTDSLGNGGYSQLPTPTTSNGQAPRELTREELGELVEIEDGIRGDLSTLDIILYRAVVNARLAGVLGSISTTKKRSRFGNWISSAVDEDAESKREYDRLLAYLDKASKSTELSAEDKSRTAVSIRVQLERGCISIYSALDSTSDQKQQYRRLHERCMDISIKTFFTELDLMGNFESYQLTLSLDDFTTSEIRSNMKEFVVVSRIDDSESESNDDFGTSSNPLIYIQMTSDPPESPDYDIGFHARIDAVEIMVTPESEWIHRIRDLIPTKGGRSSSTYWQNVSLAQLGSFGSDRAGWLGRSARALSEHKNLDLDVQINCPVVRFSGEGECTLMLHLGQAHIATESLAGVALGKLNYAFKDMNRYYRNSSIRQPQQTLSNRSPNARVAPERMDMSLCDNTSLFLTPSLDSNTMTAFPTSPKFGADHFFLGSSASVASSEGRRFAGTSATPGASMKRERHVRTSHSSFYDKFHLQLSGTKIHLLDNVGDGDESILSDFDIAVSLESSVIPSDHSHCRFKARASVNNIMLSVTRSSVVEISNIVQSWKYSISRTRQRTSLAPFVSRGDSTSFSLHDELMRELKDQVEKRKDLSDTSSTVDENEFLDVFEEDGETSWTDDNWVVNAETVLNGDDQSRKSGQKQRKARSVSDVSSISDGSRKGTQKRVSSVYLNAENLARLEEGGGEDDEESDLDSDGDSFHSAISFGGRIELANTLLEDIVTAENEIASLERKLMELSKPNRILGDTLHPNVAKRKRQERRSVKMALDRANAELRAMKASLHDLEKTVEIDVGDDTVVVESKTPHVEGQSRDREDMAAIRAKSILRLRRQRSSAVESVAGGNRNLINLSNREFFQGTLVVTSFCAKLETGSLDAEGQSFSGQLSSLSVAFSHRGRDLKVFFGADSMCLSVENSGRQQEILRGGGPRKGNIFSRVVSPDIDCFLRIALDLKQHGRDVSSKGRIILGGIEVSPETSLLPSITTLAHMIKQPSMQEHNDQSKSDFWCKILDTLTLSPQTRSQYTLVHDLYLRCSSLRFYIWDTKNSLIGAVVLTDTGLRTSLEVSPDSARLQMDSLCGNAQIYGCSDDVRFSPKELLGRKDHQGQVFRSRLRINCTERSDIDGWASGHVRNSVREVDNQNIAKSMAIDCHLGVRVQPVQIVPYTEYLLRFLTLREHSPTRETATTRLPRAISLPNKLAIRWRIDVAMEKTSIIFPSGKGDQMNVAKMPNGALQLMLSLRLCAEHRCNDNQLLPVVRAALHDVALIRSLDDWPILERSRLSMEALLSHPCLILDESSILERMEVPPESYWFETAVLLGQCKAWHGRVNSATEASPHGICMSFTAAPVKLNASSSILILLLETQSSYAKAIHWRTNVERDILPSKAPRLGLEIQAALECLHFEVKFFEDVPSAVRGGDPYSRPRFSIVSAGWWAEVLRKQDDFSASMRVTNFMVHDLSIHPGVRAVGMTHSNEKADANAFLTIRVALQRRESVHIINVTQRWGKIQLLLLPSLVDSVLSVLKDVWQTDASTMAPEQPTAQKTTAWPRETTLVRFSFETDGFECIMSSRNIFDYVRNGSEQSIGVVTFRWVSNLKGFIALVRSSGSSAMEFASMIDIVDTSKMQDEVKVIQTLRRFSENQLNAMLMLNSEDEDLRLAQSARRGVLSVNLDLQVTEFQALRTCVERAKVAPTAGEIGVTPTIFKIAPPVAGEQRITNPINFSAEYRSFGTLVSASQHSNPLDYLQLAQALRLEADMVDVLVYIRSSAGGMHDAYRITLTPIITSLERCSASLPTKK